MATSRKSPPSNIRARSTTKNKPPNGNHLVPTESPIDWDRAERVANSIANRRSDSLPATGPGVGLDELVPPGQLEDQIQAVTGLRSLSGPASVHLIDRAAWIHANIASFQSMLTPLTDRWAAKITKTGPMAGFARQVAGAEIGAMLGWMSTKVLGQYDVLLGNDGRGDAVYLVAPNMVALEQRFGFDAVEFRQWVLLHELTHRAQFTGVPWMRDHFKGLVAEIMQFAEPDPKQLLEGLRGIRSDRAAASQKVREGGIMGLMAGPQQQATMAKIGGLMSLLEGHGDVTMTRAAGTLVPSAQRFENILQARRRRGNPLSRLVMRLTGMEGKLNQYAAGERFISQVEAVGGDRVVDHCWQRVENLPSMDEIRSPQLWLARMDIVAAT